MLKKEFEKLTSKPVYVGLKDLTPRTLLYGYTCDRYSFHVYLGKDGVIYKYIYNDKNISIFEKIYVDLELDNLIELVPDKRAYPECTDYEFAQLLIDHQIYIPFLPYDEQQFEHVKLLRYYGELIE